MADKIQTLVFLCFDILLFFNQKCLTSMLKRYIHSFFSDFDTDWQKISKSIGTLQQSKATLRRNQGTIGKCTSQQHTISSSARPHMQLRCQFFDFHPDFSSLIERRYISVDGLISEDIFNLVPSSKEGAKSLFLTSNQK